MAVFPRFLLTVLGVLFGVVGLMGFCAMPLLFDPVELTVTTVSAKAEMRAAYGGTFFAMSFGAFRALKHLESAELMLSLFAVALGTFSVARVVSLVLDGVPNTFSIVMHCFEFTGFILTIIALRYRSKNV